MIDYVSSEWRWMFGALACIGVLAFVFWSMCCAAKKSDRPRACETPANAERPQSERRATATAKRQRPIG